MTKPPKPPTPEPEISSVARDLLAAYACAMYAAGEREEPWVDKRIFATRFALLSYIAELEARPTVQEIIANDQASSFSDVPRTTELL